MLAPKTAVLALLSAFLVVGCGGNGGGKNSTPTPIPLTNLNYTIDWPQRSRAIEAPASAMSVVISIPGASESGQAFTTTSNRGTDLATHSTTYTAATKCRTGSFSVNVRFYDGENGTGTLVAEGNSTLTIGTDGAMPTVTIDNKVSTVTIPPDQKAPEGHDTQLVFEAKDAGGAILAIAPGAALWENANATGAFTLSASGVVTPIGPGVGDVKVTVDGITSAAVPIIVPGPPDFLNPSFEDRAVTVHEYIFNDGTNTNWVGDANWGIANASGAWGTGGANSTPQYAFVQAKNDADPLSNGTIRQLIYGLKVGQNYRVVFSIARRTRWDGTHLGENGANVTLFANGEQIMGEVAPTTTGSWRQVMSNTFTANTANYMFEIKSVLPQFPEDQTTLIDEVHLQQAP